MHLYRIISSCTWHFIPQGLTTGCGTVTSPAALATVVTTYRAHADVLRLTIGALAQLCQVHAGRRHVLTSDAARAVVLGIRAHASDAAVASEACYFLAAIAYGGRDARQAALDAGADEALMVIARRFKGKASHQQTA